MDYTLIFSTNQDPFELITCHVHNAKDEHQAHEKAFPKVEKFCASNYSQEDEDEPFFSHLVLKGIVFPVSDKVDITIQIKKDKEFKMK